MNPNSFFIRKFVIELTKLEFMVSQLIIAHPDTDINLLVKQATNILILCEQQENKGIHNTEVEFV